jgi:hypothetical protein
MCSQRKYWDRYSGCPHILEVHNRSPLHDCQSRHFRDRKPIPIGRAKRADRQTPGTTGEPRGLPPAGRWKHRYSPAHWLVPPRQEIKPRSRETISMGSPNGNPPDWPRLFSSFPEYERVRVSLFLAGTGWVVQVRHADGRRFRGLNVANAYSTTRIAPRAARCGMGWNAPGASSAEPCPDRGLFANVSRDAMQCLETPKVYSTGCSGKTKETKVHPLANRVFTLRKPVGLGKITWCCTLRLTKSPRR